MTTEKNEQCKPFPVMEDMTVKMIEEYLQSKDSVIIPVGVTEQHGHHLPLKTDSLIAEHLSKRAGEQLGMLVAPTILQSFSGGGLAGTINYSPAVMSLVFSDLLVSLVSQGFKKFYLFLGHGGSENARALDGAIKILLRSNPAFKDVLVSVIPVWTMSSKGMGWSKSLQENDWHAGWLETSMVMAIEPELVRMDEVKVDSEPYFSEVIQHPDMYQKAEKIVDDNLVIPRMSQRDEIKIGVMGFPERASAEAGREIVDDIVANLVSKISDIESKADGVYKQIEFKPEPIVLLTDD